VGPRQVQLPDGHLAWAQSLRDHIRSAIKVCEDCWLVEDDEGCVSKNSVKNPLPSGHKPKADVPPELDGKLLLPAAHS